MFGFATKAEVDEWSIKTINLAVDRLNVQKTFLADQFVQDPQFAHAAARLHEGLLLQFEIAFLHGIFTQALRIFPGRFGRAGQMQRMYQLFFVNRGETLEEAQKLAATALQLAARNEEGFQNLSRIGTGSISDPEDMGQALYHVIKAATARFSE